MHLRSLALVSVVTLAWACGGQSLSTSDDGESGAGGDSGKGGSQSTGGSSGSTTGGTGTGATGGSSTGGSSTGGSSTGGSSTGGTAGSTGGSGGGNCLAFPSCAPYEVQIPGPEYCIAGAPCHEASICGATIWCTEEPLCDAVPVCDAGDTQVSGPCPPELSCYARTACLTTIWCVDKCNPETEPNRNCLLKECAPGDGWSCPLPNTTSFVNECGCGCEQAPDCPSIFYCRRAPMAKSGTPEPELPAPSDAGAPGASAPPFCDEAELTRCPYTETAY